MILFPYFLTLFFITDTLFNKTYGSNGSDRGIEIIEGRDGNYMIVGNSTGPSGDLDVYLLKLDHEGDKIWEHTYGGNEDDNGWSVKETNDNGFIITGFTKSYGAINNDILLLKVDNMGNEEWIKTFGMDGDDIGWAIDITTNGNFIIAAQTNSFGAGDLDAYLLCTNASGDSLWSRTYGGPQVDRVFSITQTENGEIAMAGITYSFGAGDRDAYLILTDSAGNFKWHRTYGGPGYDNAHHVITNKLGNLILTGYGDHFSLYGQRDIFLKEIDTRGNEIWSNSFGGGDHDHGINVIQTSNNGYLITGYTFSYGEGALDAYTVKTDEKGRQIWYKTFGGASNDSGYCSIQDQNGNYVMTGRTFDMDNSNSDLMVIKFNNK